jgi:2-polyprenyl-6-methoxyphenol hydroxylase-like FAD-dependent oxidoreductase
MSRDHAVVIGCSFAGLGAARMLSDLYTHVTVVERDELPETWSPRRGVPQSPHVHGIPQLGRTLLAEILPGFVDRAKEHGAVFFDQLRDGALWGLYGWSARGHSPAVGFGVRRALLEHVAREMVLEIPSVSVVHGRAEHLLASGDTVTGVRLRTADDHLVDLTADLVVDASGKGTAAAGWLEREGFPVPHETTVNGFVGYASRWLEVPDDAWPGDYRFISQLPRPQWPRGGILYPQDNGLYVMSLFGHAHHYPPGEEDEFVDFLTGCATPLMHHVVSRSRPVSGISRSRSTANRRRHYELLDTVPAGFVAVGDALASFNPIFGQGISSGLKAAMVLADTLRAAEGDDAAVPARFYRDFTAWLDTPWNQAIGFDLAFPTTTGPRPDPTPERQAAARYADVLAQMSTVDPEVAGAVLFANQSFDPSLVRTPELLAAAESWVRDGRSPVVPHPARPPAPVS